MLNNTTKKQIRKLMKEQPGLEFCSETGFLSGFLVVDDGDKYFVDIDINKFPDRFPTVWETGERIPKTQDRHVYTKTGSCCFTTDAKEQVLLKTRIHTLEQFIKLIVIPYFQNNSFYEINKKYKFNEYEHGIKGVMQGYCDILGADKINLTVLALLLRISNIKYINGDKCFCGNENISDCHLSNYKQLFLVSSQTIISDLVRYFTYYN